MRIAFAIGIGLSVASLAGRPAAAQGVTVPDRLSLTEALRLALEHNPTLAAARQQWSLAASDQVVASQRPNPVFSFSSEGLTSSRPAGLSRWNGQELILQVEQEIETNGRRGLRQRSAAAGAAAGRAGFEEAARQLRYEVEQAYYQLALARTEAATAEESLQEIDRIIAVNRAKYEQGEISGGELRRLEVERLRFTGDALAAELATRNARSTLLALVGSARLDQPVEPADALAAPPNVPSPADVEALTTRALAGRPDVAAARHEQARARSDAELQRAVRTPNVSFAGGYRRDFGENGLLLGVTVPLPIFDRNAGGMARSDAQGRLSDARLRVVEAAVSLEVRQALDVVDIARQRVDVLEREYLRKAREALDSVAAAYRVGDAELIDFLDAQRAFRDVRRAHSRALLDLRLSLSQLDTAVGVFPGGPLS
ncbi:MAG: TolC family protein [Acidobacteria bacterium]|nr:MAG: TolC family protein [Acidobacteriota bacterium]